MRATYPAYLGRPRRSDSPSANRRAFRRERSSTSPVARRPRCATFDSATVGDTFAFRVNDHAFEGRFAARKSGHYAWIANGTSGPIADVPPPLELEVVPDSAPHVELVSPATDTIVAGDDKITLHATASDDHGIAHVELVTWRQGSTGVAQPPTTQRLADASVDGVGRQRGARSRDRAHSSRATRST